MVWPLRLKYLYDALHGVWDGSKSWGLELGVLPISSHGSLVLFSARISVGVFYFALFLSYHPEHPSPLQTLFFSFLYNLIRLIRTRLLLPVFTACVSAHVTYSVSSI
jgi:hypothetical protein